MKSKLDLPALLISIFLALVIVGVISLIATTFWMSEYAGKKECTEQGGKVVEVHGMRSGWFCEERR